MQIEVASILNFLGITVGAVGIFFGFYFLTTDLSMALRVVTCLSVGVVGLLAFVRHVVFRHSDAIRLGWQTSHPAWQLEVGFANLAFSVPALFTSLLDPSETAFFVLLGAYSLYLAQAAALHGIMYFKGQSKSLFRLSTSTIATALFAIMLAVFSGYAFQV